MLRTRRQEHLLQDPLIIPPLSNSERVTHGMLEVVDLRLKALELGVHGRELGSDGLFK